MSVADIRCPYCNEKIGYEPEELLWNDGDEQEKECRYCQKKFKVITYESVNFEAETLDKEAL